MNTVSVTLTEKRRCVVEVPFETGLVQRDIVARAVALAPKHDDPKWSQPTVEVKNIDWGL